MRVFIAGSSDEPIFSLISSGEISEDHLRVWERIEFIQGVGNLARDLELIQSCEILIADVRDETLEAALHTAIAARQGVYTMACVADYTPDIYCDLLDRYTTDIDKVVPGLIEVIGAYDAWSEATQAEEVRPTSIYIIGPQRKISGYNVDAFDDAVGYLRASGWMPTSQIDLDREEGLFGVLTNGVDFSGALRRDMTVLASCGALGLLPGWEGCSSAVVALSIAEFLSLPVYEILDGKVSRVNVNHVLTVSK